MQVHPMVLIQETESCSIVDSCFTCSMFSLHRLIHEYSNHDLPDYTAHGKNQQKEMYMVESNGQRRLLQMK